jgi:hypothetical protein
MRSIVSLRIRGEGMCRRCRARELYACLACLTVFCLLVLPPMFCREELVALRTTKTVPGERREITEIPPLEPTVVEAPVEEPMEEEVPLEKMVVASLMDCEPDSTEQVEDTTDENAVPAGATGETASADTETVQVSSGSTEPPLVDDSVEEEKKQEAADEAEPSVEGDAEDDFCDVDSDDSVGFEEAAEDGDSLLGSNDECDQEEEADPTSTAGKVSVMFQRLLNMGGAGSSGQLVMHVDAKPPDAASAPSPSTELTPSATPAFSASTSHGGRMICTLPDHPIHAGATAVVAVVIGKTIAVANAGDSRAVLCRDGNAFPLSYDHKPQQERELTRIRNAGGFVNQYGRINGNLNLSRSIGDLKYKQVPHVLIAEQMITAEPDIIRYVQQHGASPAALSTCIFLTLALVPQNDARRRRRIHSAGMRRHLGLFVQPASCPIRAVTNPNEDSRRNWY